MYIQKISIEKSSTIIISNCCLGSHISNIISNVEYNNPFIGSLIPEDTHYLKLCKNFKQYIYCEPICDYNPSDTTEYSKQIMSVWYNHPACAKNYPIIHLDDIEIHFIHESTLEETIDKFKRRMERCKKLIESNNYKLFFVSTWTNLFTIHLNNDYSDYIKHFLSNNNNSNEKYIFLGPKNYIKDDYYIDDHFFDLNIKRRINNVNIEIDFAREGDIIINFINTLL